MADLAAQPHALLGVPAEELRGVGHLGPRRPPATCRSRGEISRASSSLRSCIRWNARISRSARERGDVAAQSSGRSRRRRRPPPRRRRCPRPPRWPGPEPVAGSATSSRRPPAAGRQTPATNRSVGTSIDVDDRAQHRVHDRHRAPPVAVEAGEEARHGLAQGRAVAGVGGADDALERVDVERTRVVGDQPFGARRLLGGPPQLVRRQPELGQAWRGSPPRPAGRPRGRSPRRPGPRPTRRRDAPIATATAASSGTRAGRLNSMT